MQRLNKVNQLIKREISSMIQKDVHDPRLEFVTITHVDVTKDLQQARVSFTVLGDAAKVKLAQEGLESARGFIRRLIGQRIRIRYTPEIIFVYDASVEYGARIEETLERIKNESKEHS